LSRWARNYVILYSLFYEPAQEVKVLSGEINKLISDANIFLLNTMKDLADQYGSGYYSNGSHGEGLREVSEKIKSRHTIFKKQINNCLCQLFKLYETNKAAHYYA